MKNILKALAILLLLFFTFSCGGNAGGGSADGGSAGRGDEDEGNGSGGTIPGTPSAAFSLSQYGITWYFDRVLTPGVDYGQFINGDYWVVGAANIVYIDPHSTEINGRTKNGAMLNPDPDIGNKGYDKEAQGYDSHMWQGDHHYYPSLNVALDVTESNPLILPPGSSLVSCISHDNPSNRPQLQTAAVLTILDQTPPDGSFRPPYSGTNKTVSHNISTVNANLTKLLSLSSGPLTNVPSVAAAQEWFKRPWLEHIPGYLGAYIHPIDNMPEYGGNVASRISQAAIWLHLDFTEAEKMPLLIGFIQCGIDFYGIIQNGYQNSGKTMQWWSAGGQCAGRKWPILFAGSMLNDQGMIGIVSNPDILFQEDGQTFHVDQAAIDYTNYNQTMCGHNESNYACGGYTQNLLGLPDWGIAHGVSIDRDTPRWETMYRQCCTARNWGGFVLAAIMMDLTSEWDHDVIFDYMDRYFHYEDTYNGGTYRQDSPFVGSAWTEYRDDFSANWPLIYWSTMNNIIYNMYPEDH
jgi:hypothetical protein